MFASYSPNLRKSGRSKLWPTLISTLSLLCLSSTLPADAYYWNSYRYGNWGTNLLYSIPYLATPLLFGRGPYNANPIYSVSNYLRRGPQRALTAPLRYRPYYLQNYKDQEPFYDPRSRNRPVKPANIGMDQIVHAQWKQNSDPFNAPIPGDPNSYSQPPNTTPQITPYSPPPTAPPIQRNNFPVQPFSVRDTSPKASSAPIADGFISMINQQFDGNLQTALYDPAARSWAKALGLIENNKILKAEFTPTRIHLIRQILRDESLDSVSKLNAIKILLPAGANRAKKSGI